MKLLASTVLAAMVAFTAGAVHADTADDVGNGVKHTDKTVTHGASGVGKGASKIYHDVAKDIHTTIAKNTGNSHKKAVHLQKADQHEKYATEKARQSDKEINRSSKEADKVTK